MWQNLRPAALADSLHGAARQNDIGRLAARLATSVKTAAASGRSTIEPRREMRSRSGL